MTYRIFGTGPAQREAYELYRGREQIKHERGFVMGGLGADAAEAVQDSKDWGQAVQNFTAAWDTLTGAMGSPMAQASIPVMNAFGNAFKGIAEQASHFPKLSNVAGDTGLGGSLGGLIGGALGAVFGFGGGALPGAAIGAAIGSGLGLGYGVSTSGNLDTPSDVSSPRAATPWLPKYQQSVGLGNFALPPTQTVKNEPAKVEINIDGRKVGDAMIDYIVNGGKMPIGGSPYFDPSTGAVPFDLVR
jgi:hypothetical protein